MFRRLSYLICAAVLVWIPLRASAFAVSPAIIDLAGKRGGSIEGAIVVINSSTAEQTYYLGTLKFVPRESSGTPEFIPFETDHSGLPEWIGFPVRTVTIPANTKVDVPFTVAIPNGTPSGSVYAAITVSSAPSEIVATNGASIEAKTAVLVFLTVEGETVEKIALLDFTSASAGSILSTLAVPYQFRIQNQGNVVVQPAATVRVTDLFGRTVVESDVNAEQGRVLPGSTRTFSGQVVADPSGFLQTVRQQLSMFAIGPVAATLSVDGTIASIQFWMFPWQLIVCAIVIVILLKLIWNGLTRSRDRLGQIRTGT